MSFAGEQKGGVFDTADWAGNKGIGITGDHNGRRYEYDD
jgi:hypothetical protein